MSKVVKVYEKLMSGNADFNFAFSDLCLLLLKLGYDQRQRGSHLVFTRGESLINIQNLHGKANPTKSVRREKNCKPTISSHSMRGMHDPKDYEISIRWSPDDQCYVARVVAWHGVAAHGDTMEEAAREIQAALTFALEVAEEKGMKIPAPALHAAA